MRTNVAYWQQLQDRGYFDNHPLYRKDGGALIEGDGNDANVIQWFTPLTKDMNVVVIGCGYGRETAEIAPHVRHVWGVDVNDTILKRAKAFLTDRGVPNFTPVRAEDYAAEVPSGIDLVYSIVVMQHLTRDLAEDYFATLSKKLNPGGRFVVQFFEQVSDRQADAELRAYEPRVSWAGSELAQMCMRHDLTFECRSALVIDDILWHWVHARRR